MLLTDTEIRFWEKVEVAEPDECWLWLGSCDTNGYGHFRINNKLRQAHRYSYQLHFGDIPKGMCICHCCDVRSCVNPNHLFFGTYKDNMVDCIKKGRYSVGHSFALTIEQEEIIKELYATGEYKMKELAESYNIDRNTIARIIKRKR